MGWLRFGVDGVGFVSCRPSGAAGGWGGFYPGLAPWAIFVASLREAVRAARLIFVLSHPCCARKGHPAFHAADPGYPLAGELWFPPLLRKDGASSIPCR